jgi:hypothetical protein
MARETERQAAAQAKADEVVRSVADTPEGSPMLLIAVVDQETGNRLATGFVSYQVDGPQLRLVAS